MISEHIQNSLTTATRLWLLDYLDHILDVQSSFYNDKLDTI